MSTSTSPIWKYVGITATGAAALTIFLNYARRQDNKNIIEVERLQMMVDVLGAKIDDVEKLLKAMNEEIRSQRGPRLKTSNSNGALKTVSFKLAQKYSKIDQKNHVFSRFSTKISQNPPPLAPPPPTPQIECQGLEVGHQSLQTLNMEMPKKIGKIAEKATKD
ncbi:hypothetical protein CRE_06053 [Caenorhabditis remanei]|uniref:Uncharacterized protein n=1 Tax=Caenorhabditis remanei TaxID=31234 RepID=E3NAX6_CAERE|nr:hypothetical protein CRE_06053 [Caenorhabditis remanei]